MDKLNIITSKYEVQLNEFVYCDNENIYNIPLGSNIIYIDKNNIVLKKGILKNYKNTDILGLTSRNKVFNWFIYTNKYYIFYKAKTNNLKLFLKELVKSDFTSIKHK